jgi:serine/threonine-protein kinase
MTYRLRAIAMSVLVVSALAGTAVAAPSAEQRSAAEALFQEARDLMSKKSFAAACEKFAASQELDPGLGTQLHLADCYDVAGKTASAWALFRDAAMLAKRAGDTERQHIAEQRAENLTPRLSKLELHVRPSRSLQGLELRLNGVAIPKASWNTALPIDPGPLTVEASAPGKKPWKYQGVLAEGPGSRTIDIPVLDNAPKSAQPATPLGGTVNQSAPGSTQRAVGYFVAATGIVALAVGGAFGYRAYALNQRSKGKCRSDDANACTKEGVDLREDAQHMGVISTVASIGGGVLAASGVTLVLTAPSASSGKYAEHGRPSAGLELGLRGTW